MEKRSMADTILEIMDRGVDILKIGMAAEKCRLTVEEMQKMNQENGLNFGYKRCVDILTIEKEQE